MCNKCESIHSKLLQFHNLYKLDKEINEIFTDYCQEEKHNDLLEFYCKNHNQLCCSACIAKIKKKGKGQHTDCNVCVIEDIKEEKKNNLKDNIKILENLCTNLDESINKIKIISDKINKNKEDLKIKVQQIFTKIRTAINDREDQLLLEIDNIYKEKCFNDNIIDKDKFKNKIELSLEKGKIIDKEWDDKNLISTINDCINIEKNIEEIKIIIDNIKKYNDLNDSNINFNLEKDDEINIFLEKIKKIGQLSKKDSPIDSLILNDNEFFLKIKRKINENKNIIFKLLYRKSKDGDSCDTFHNMCDNQGPTLTLFENSNGFKFGGYTPLSWDYNSSWKTDDDTFLFSLTNNKIHKKLKGIYYSIYCQKDIGPWFAFIGVEKSMSKGKYIVKENVKEFPFENYDTFIKNKGKDITFDVKEVEVYKIILN